MPTPGAPVKGELCGNLKKWVDSGAALWFFIRSFESGRTMYAVIETGSKQYRVAAGDLVKVERLEAEAGASVTLDRVLLVAGDGKLAIGQPTVPQATRSESTRLNSSHRL